MAYGKYERLTGRFATFNRPLPIGMTACIDHGLMSCFELVPGRHEYARRSGICHISSAVDIGHELLTANATGERV